jgi:hypothetical protein
MSFKPYSKYNIQNIDMNAIYIFINLYIYSNSFIPLFSQRLKICYAHTHFVPFFLEK